MYYVTGEIQVIPSNYKIIEQEEFQNFDRNVYEDMKDFWSLTDEQLANASIGSLTFYVNSSHYGTGESSSELTLNQIKIYYEEESGT